MNRILTYSIIIGFCFFISYVSINGTNQIANRSVVETISYKDFIDCNGYAEARNSGKLRLEGKDYIVRDGDILLFRFNT